MRIVPLLLPCLTWITFASAQASELTSVIAQLPKCAQSCLVTSMHTSPCKLDDVACICADMTLQAEVEHCVLKSCTLRQALTTKNETATLCNAPVRNTGNRIRVSNIIVAVTSAACALARLIYKAWFSVGELGWDDYTVLAALVSGVPSVIMIDRGIVPNGLGMDVWTVPFDKITEFVRWLYILEVMYFLQIALIKLTLLFFFLRIFPKRAIRILLWATVIFTSLWGVAFMIVAIFQCQPISYYWMKWDQEHVGKCININALAWTNAIISMVLDVWMLALPLYEVFQLQLSWRKKISVALMFFVGTFVTVVSGLRLKSLLHFAASNNPTWDQTEVINWSNLEINIGIICACLPALRVILVRMFPRLMGTTKNTTQPQYQQYGSRSQGMGKLSALKSSHSKKMNSSTAGTGTITYTKTFAVQHTDSDETSLVRMEEFGSKTSKPRSSNTSVTSL